MIVSIVCQGESWKDWTPGDETWAVNMMGMRIPHDLIWHMDDCRVQERRAEAGNRNVKTLLEFIQDRKFITSTVYPEYENAIEFPLDDIFAEFETMYFNSTVSYAIAYAIYMGFKEIRLYGADFTYPDRHKAEMGRGCVEYWLGRAIERGIKVTLPQNTSLMDMNIPCDWKPYGYDGYSLINGWLFPKDLPTAEEIEARYG